MGSKKKQKKTTSDWLADSASGFRESFSRANHLLSMPQYLELVEKTPSVHCRDSARYLKECMEYFGTETVYRPYGVFNRFKLFDCEFDEHRDALIGQEIIQEKIYGLLTDFVRFGRVNRLILLNGPNGSAKSRIISCLMRACEYYSEQPEGALYSFSWIFPTKKVDKTGIGFSSTLASESISTFAHLDEADVDARIHNETTDHPLLLLPKPMRTAFFERFFDNANDVPLYLREGELSPKNRQIFDNLLRAYKGDLNEVFKHIQVERVSMSRRYRRTLVTVDPQMRVDAAVRQVTADRSLGALPPSLQTLTLFEPMGDLVDANRGMLEFNDLLKRPVETFKYLLATCETGVVRLDTMDLYLDMVLIGSCNADHLTAFKQIPDFASFKERLELITVPYLLDFPAESQIYWEQLRSLSEEINIGPHVPDVLALWAVLCRLERAHGWEPLDEETIKGIQAMSAVDKANLYAYGILPSSLSRESANSLRSAIPTLFAERLNDEHYEGRFGPSPRELKGVLLSAARFSPDSLTGVEILSALHELTQQTAVYPFLSLEADEDYHNPELAISTVHQWYLGIVEDELHQAMGLVDQSATVELLTTYIDHVVHFIRKEKRANPMTGRSEDPDAALMQDVESKLGISKKEGAQFRESMVHRIAAWSMDNRDETLKYEEIFADLVSGLNDAFYNEKRKTADRVKRNLVALLTSEDPRLDAQEKAQAEETLANLEKEFGYPEACALQVVAFLLRHRPVDEPEDANNN
ncbi:MAG: serine protein kinase PrkA [Bradymonadia bacterium]